MKARAKGAIWVHGRYIIISCLMMKVYCKELTTVMMRKRMAAIYRKEPA